jgi:hypothetical protein
MARLKRKSSVVETAKVRLAGLNAISPAPDFGPALTKVAYQTRVTSLETALAEYNGRLSALDEEQNRIDTMEEELNQWNKRILSAGEATYGTDSSEYEMLGGTRTSERQRLTRRSTKGNGGNGTPTT